MDYLTFSEKPCFCPPHPDLLARQQVDTARAQADGTTQQAFAMTNNISGPRTGRIPGMNDGTIFPESHFDAAPTLSLMSRAALERAPLRGPTRVAVVLVEFTDKKFNAGAKANFQDLFFSTGKIATGSVTEYYKEVSKGLVTLTGEVVGPFQLRNPSTYYANNDHGRGNSFPNSRTMADEALTLADGSLNFSPYDNDGNGYVDGYIVVHAGPGGEVTGNKNDIWSVKWVLPRERTVMVYAFLTIPQDAKIGVCAHELGHLLFGWPDLYDIDNSSAGVGNWCLMAAGSWGGGGSRPVHPSAWCKANQGWVDVINETTNHQVAIGDVKTTKKVHRLWKDGDATGKEYFLVENRQTTAFDGNLPGSGLLIWHIDDSVDNNANERHPKVGLLQADGREELQTRASLGDGGDPFPGTSNNVSFTATSNPGSKSYYGADTFVSVTGIPRSSPSMTVNITVKPQARPVSASITSSSWYQLRNSLTGYSLDVINDGAGNKEGHIQLAREGNSSGQYWQFRPRPDGTYEIRNLFLGPNRALDVYGNDKTVPHVAEVGYYSGQYWTMTPWGDGSYRLDNAYSGPYLLLDSLDGGTKVRLSSGPNSGRPTQRWTLTKVRDVTEGDFLA